MVRIRAALNALACAGIALTLTACGGEVAKGGDGDNRSQMTFNAAVAGPMLAPAVPRAAPVTDSLHFDLVCDLHGRIVSESHSDMPLGTYPAGMRAWHYHSHHILDLQAMLVCDASVCGEYPLRRIVRATADRIVLNDEPGLSVVIYRRGWRYEQRQDNGGTSVTRGQCTPSEFSGFPIRTRPAESR